MAPSDEPDQPSPPPGTLPPPQRMDLGRAVQEARALLSGSKRTFLAMTATLFGAILVAGVVIGVPLGEALFPSVPDAPADPRAEAILVLTTALVTAPMQGGLVLASLARAAGSTVQFAALFSGTRFTVRFLGLGALLGLVSVMGGMLGPLGAVTSLLVSLVSVFAPYALVDRDLTIADAILRSVALVAANLPATLGSIAVAILAVLLAVVTLGIALIWVIPFLLLLPAVLYRQGAGA